MTVPRNMKTICKSNVAFRDLKDPKVFIFPGFSIIPK